MASGPITAWQIDGETMEAVTEFIFFGSKITADGDWSHENKRCLLLGRKAMTKLDNILKSIDITLPTEAHLIKAIVFPVVMYGYESWTIMKAECQRIDAFEPLNWRRLLRVPWTARRSNPVNPPGNKTWIFIGRTDGKAEAQILWPPEVKWLIGKCREFPNAGKYGRQEKGDDRGWDSWMTSQTQWTWAWVSSGSWWWTGNPGVLQSMGSQRIEHKWLNWTEVNQMCSFHNLSLLSLAHLDNSHYHKLALGNLNMWNVNNKKSGHFFQTQVLSEWT